MTSIMNRHTPGEVYEVFDQYGTPKGRCIFMEIIEPGTLTLKEVVRPMHWHIKVLHKGKIEFYDASLFTLVEFL